MPNRQRDITTLDTLYVNENTHVVGHMAPSACRSNQTHIHRGIFATDALTYIYIFQYQNVMYFLHRAFSYVACRPVHVLLSLAMEKSDDCLLQSYSRAETEILVSDFSIVIFYLFLVGTCGIYLF
jgi:hypothetical protein